MKVKRADCGGRDDGDINGLMRVSQQSGEKECFVKRKDRVVMLMSRLLSMIDVYCSDRYFWCRV